MDEIDQRLLSLLRQDGNQTRTVITALWGEPGVATLHGTKGRWELRAELRAETLQELGSISTRGSRFKDSCMPSSPAIASA